MDKHFPRISAAQSVPTTTPTFQMYDKVLKYILTGGTFVLGTELAGGQMPIPLRVPISQLCRTAALPAFFTGMSMPNPEHVATFSAISNRDDSSILNAHVHTSRSMFLRIATRSWPEQSTPRHASMRLRDSWQEPPLLLKAQRTW